jgi:hypothetical protein
LSRLRQLDELLDGAHARARQTAIAV